MLITTCDVPAGTKVTYVGLVRGNVVQSKNIGRDIMASFKTVVGGEIKSYTDMTNESRNIAEQRMIAAAEKLGADAVFCVRFSTDTVMQGTIDTLCYGTAVKFIE